MPDFGQPVGYAQISLDAITAVLLSASVPKAANGDVLANMAVIRPTGNNVRMRQDGTAPTTTVGFPLNTTDTEAFALIGIGALMGAQFIAVTGTAKLEVLFYSGGKLN